jgi:hypothetical protein
MAVGTNLAEEAVAEEAVPAEQAAGVAAEGGLPEGADSRTPHRNLPLPAHVHTLYRNGLFPRPLGPPFSRGSSTGSDGHTRAFVRNGQVSIRVVVILI